MSESERDGQTRKEGDIAILIFVNPIGATHNRSERSIDSVGIYADLAHETATFRCSIKNRLISGVISPAGIFQFCFALGMAKK